ncbi:DUF2783 domain-containing protein [Pelagibacterium sp.]|uniref:DUF2783 domain-containing protein n=1 Tax=Pelagibacterium sp. TaxID=1967288 RepID=UPI003A942D81
MKLNIEPNENTNPDEIYSKLNALGRDVSDRESRRALAALVLLLSNHIGDEAVLDDAIALVEKLPPLATS